MSSKWLVSYLFTKIILNRCLVNSGMSMCVAVVRGFEFLEVFIYVRS